VSADRMKATNLQWMVDVDGTPVVRLLVDMPAGTYDPDSAELFGETLIAGAKRSRDMAAVRKWLVEAGVSTESVQQLLTELGKKKESDDLRGVLRPLFGGGWS